MLSLEYLIRRTNEKANEVNAPKYKIVPALYTYRTKLKHNKEQLELYAKVVDCIFTKFGLENELSNLLD